MAPLNNKIYIGSMSDPDYYFENDKIFDAPFTQAVAMVGQELSIDTFSPVVMDDIENLMILSRFRSSDGIEIQLGDTSIFAVDVGDGLQASDLINIAYRTPVWYYQENTLIGKFYVDNVVRQGKNRYQINTVSAIGILDRLEHGGGLFQSTTFGVVLAHILAEDKHGTGSSVIQYAIDDDVADLPVSGWLPNASKRNNLYQLVFANGVNIIKDANGDPRFTFLYTAPDDAVPVQKDIYNEGDVEYTRPYASVVVHEHTYTARLDAEAVTLFDNTTGESVTQKEVWFTTAPVIVSTLHASSGLTIVSASENSAIVTGTGSLTGIPYLHETREVRVGAEEAEEAKTVSVKDCTMVSLINSTNLLNRLSAFYQPSDFIRKIKNAIVYSGERCGKQYSFPDPFGERVTAFLAKITGSVSSFIKADCEWYAEYEPAGQAGLYQHVVVLEPTWDEEEEEWVLEGDWNVPTGVTEFKAVLIGGGTGGDSGWPGKNGFDATTYTEVEQTADISAMWYGAEGGDGGEGGSGGNPGRVKVVTLTNVTPGDSYHWTLGDGGDGGASTGFIPDTVNELRAALQAEDPNAAYTTAEIQEMIAQEDTDWNGAPNTGSAGTATTFGIEGGTTYSTADNDAYVPTGGVYEPITGTYYALQGNLGIRGGKGGARKVSSNGTFNWITDGEDVVGPDGTVYFGGNTGNVRTTVQGLPEAKIMVYGGNGAGAAVGIGRELYDGETGDELYPHIDGGSDQTTSWEVTTDGV